MLSVGFYAQLQNAGIYLGMGPDPAGPTPEISSGRFSALGPVVPAEGLGPLKS